MGATCNWLQHIDKTAERCRPAASAVVCAGSLASAPERHHAKVVSARGSAACFHKLH